MIAFEKACTPRGKNNKTILRTYFARIVQMFKYLATAYLHDFKSYNCNNMPYVFENPETRGNKIKYNGDKFLKDSS